ncbi:hypothetical protein EDD11_001044 [Mortierella claussenii]|nr:hypothetical protein EDD11_001044 [Mortierella claussenii]
MSNHETVAEGDSVELLQEELAFLSRMARVSIQGKITSKKISTWLKSTFERNSILAIEPPEGHLANLEATQDDLDPHHQQDADGYLSDSSYISQGDMTDVAYSTHHIKTRRPLRRAISLEDLTAAASSLHHYHHHHSSSLQSNRLQSKQTTASHLLHDTALSHHLLLHPTERPASSASIYHRRPHSRATDQGDLSIVPSKDNRHPNPAMAVVKDDSYGHEHVDHGSLPTPEVSPEELSESSEELVVIQGELLEEARSARIHHDRMRPTLHGSFPETQLGVGAATGGEGTLTETATIAETINGGGEAMMAPLTWLTDSPFIDALVNWIEGPDHPVQQKNQDKDKPNPLMDIPLQFIALLTYPEPDPKNGNKMTLAMVRETAFVRQRRKTLLMLTIYTLVVRYCSFDFFLVVLFASNCAMLFLMKNSGRMNVNMAKRAVRQRVGWAKQWAGGIFKRGGGGGSVSNSHGNSNALGSKQQQQQYSNGSPLMHTGGSQSPSTADFARQLQGSPVNGENTSPGATVEGSPQMKRRGLFGKRRTVDNTSSSSSSANALHHMSSPSVQAVHVSVPSSLHGNSSPQFDGYSIVSSVPTAAGNASTSTTATTQKRRFFRRNNNSHSSGSISYNGISTNNSQTIVASSNSVYGSSIQSGALSAIPTSRPSCTTSNSSSSSNPSASQQQQQQQQQQQRQDAETTPNSTSRARLNATNTPLSSSPLAQSQSLSQLHLSPPRSFSPLPPAATAGPLPSDKELKAIAKGMKTIPSPPLPLTLEVDSSKREPMAIPTTVASFESMSTEGKTSASAPVATSGFSRLLGGSGLVLTHPPLELSDLVRCEGGELEDARVHEHDEHDEHDDDNDDNDEEEEDDEKEQQVGKDEEAEDHSTLDAVTSAAADAMEGV